MTPVHVSVKHRQVVVPFLDSVRNLFPSAPEVTLGGNRFLSVPHLPTETFMLRRLDFDVPPPILSHYSWPHPPDKPPFDVQKLTSALLSMNQRAYVLNGLGTGKTRALLWAWHYLRNNNLAGKLLVLAPLSTLEFTWEAEVFATLGLRCVVLHGDKKRRLERLADPDAEVFILNHDGPKVILDEILARLDIDCLGIDELAVYRNGGAARTKLVRKLAARMKWVWGMTGGPIPHSPTDAWAEATIITPHTVPKFYGRFRDELMLKVSNFKYVPKKDAVDRAYAALQPAVRYTIDDIKELPERIDRTVDVALGPIQAKVYKDLVEHCVAGVQSHQITAANAGAVMMKLLQVSAGWVYTGTQLIVPLDNNKRIEALIDAIYSTDRKVLVFSPFKHALEGISQALTKEGIEHATVSGDTPMTRRSEIFNLFQNTDKYKVLNAHPQCLAHGITLTAANTIVWFAPTTSNEIYDQANHRIIRVGQTSKQLILHLQSTPVEKKIYALLRQQQQVQGQLLDLFEHATRQ